MIHKEDEGVDSKLVHAFLQFHRLYRFTDAPEIYCDADKQKKKCKLRYSEYWLLFYIRHHVKANPEGATASEISAMMHVKPPTINPPLTNLEKLGLIERKPDQNDRRYVRIKLSPAGIQFTIDHEKALFDRIHGLAVYLGEDKSNNLAELMNDVFQYFSENARKP